MSEDDIRVWMARIETKLDISIARVDDHETRMRRVERWMWAAVAVGMAGGFSGIWSLMGG